MSFPPRSVRPAGAGPGKLFRHPFGDDVGIGRLQVMANCPHLGAAPSSGCGIGLIFLFIVRFVRFSDRSDRARFQCLADAEDNNNVSSRRDL
jgi:hypothetical protein